MFYSCDRNDWQQAVTLSYVVPPLGGRHAHQRTKCSASTKWRPYGKSGQEKSVHRACCTVLTDMKLTHLTRLPSQIDRSLAFLDFRGAHMSERTVPWLWTSAGKTKSVC